MALHKTFFVLRSAIKFISKIRFCYFGAFMYKYIAINKNKMLGIQTATKGGTFPLMAKVEEIVWKSM